MIKCKSKSRHRALSELLPVPSRREGGIDGVASNDSEVQDDMDFFDAGSSIVVSEGNMDSVR